MLKLSHLEVSQVKIYLVTSSEHHILCEYWTLWPDDTYLIHGKSEEDKPNQFQEIISILGNHCTVGVNMW